MVDTYAQPRVIFRWFVIYGPETKDFFGNWVVREWLGVRTPRLRSGSASPPPVGFRFTPSPATAFLAGSLAEARNYIPDGYHNIGRHACDDPVIAEVWI